MSLFGEKTTGSADVNTVESVKSGVVDRSGEVMGKTMSGFFDSMGKIKTEIQDNKANKSLTDYQLKLSRISAGIDQKAYTPAQARMLVRKLTDETLVANPASGKEIRAILKASESSSFGVNQAKHSEDPEVKADKEALEKAFSLGLVHSGSSEEDRQLAILNLKKVNRQKEEMEDFLKKTQVHAAKGKVNDEVVKEKATEQLRIMMVKQRPILNSRLRVLMERHEKGELNDAEVNIQIAGIKAEYEEQLAPFYGANVNKSMLDNFRTGLKHTVEAYEGAISGKVSKEAMANRLSIVKNTLSLGLFKDNPEAAAMAVVGQVFKDIPVNYIVSNKQRYEEMVKTAAANAERLMAGQPMSGNGPDLLSPDPDTRKSAGAYMRLFKKSAGEFTKESLQKDKVKSSQVFAQMYGVLESLANDNSRVTKPEDISHIVTMLSSPEGKTILDSMREQGVEIPKDIMDKATEVVQREYREKAMPLVEQEWLNGRASLVEGNEAMMEAAGLDPEAAKQKEEAVTAAVQKAIVAEFGKDGMVFRLEQSTDVNFDDKMAKDWLKSMNEKVAPVVNSLVNVEANMTGKSPEEIYNSGWKHAFDLKQDTEVDPEREDELSEYLPTEDEAAAAIKDFGDIGAEVGSLSAKYESKGDWGAYGEDSTGGPSYGKYQIASYTGTFGNYMDYVKEHHPNVYMTLEGAGGETAAKEGSAEFQRTFKELMRDPKNAKSQHDFVKVSHYDKAVKALGSSFDEASASTGMKDVIWSLAVQHGAGGAKKIYTKALTKAGIDATERDLVEAIYDVRASNGGRTYFKSSTPQIQRAVFRRFQLEKADALAALK